MASAWITGILGVWIGITPFFGFAPMTNAWIDWIVGVVIAVSAFTLAVQGRWQGWVAAILGIWLFIAGFIPALRMGAGLWWNNLPAGLIVLVAGFAALGRTQTARVTPPST